MNAKLCRWFVLPLCALPLCALALGALALGTLATRCQAEVRPDQAFEQQATWQAPSGTTVRERLTALLDELKLDAAARKPILDRWTEAETLTDSGQIFDRLVQSLAAADPRAKELVELSARARDRIVLPEFTWLADPQTPALERNNLRLLYGRWLAQEKLYDEALEQLDGLKTEDSVDPAGLLFYQAAVHHQLLQKEPGLQAIARLLEPRHEIPRRYTSVAKLMQADLEPLKDESLDHIARRMDDIRRRLDLGRAGPKVREVEDGVIKSLDKLIEEIEKQQAAAAAAMAAGAAGNIRSSSPAPDSMPLGGKGPGNVTKKDVGHQSGWGDLPPKQRQEALQQIGKDFPAHYRDVIEQYFRKLASDETEKE